jgi:D-lactate dehydrogenase (cytochrome)
VTDICVPISRLAECITETKNDLGPVSFPATIVGHVGDGNFHVLCVLDPDNTSQFEEANQFAELIVQRALRMGGTCTGEHGTGYGKWDTTGDTKLNVWNQKLAETARIESTGHKQIGRGERI